MDQGIKSRPRYQPLALDATGWRHLVITDQAELPGLAFAVPPDGAELWHIAAPRAAPRAAPPGAGSSGSAFATTGDMLTALAARLACEHAGFRLYAAGTEAFIWDAEAIARDTGMGAGEFFMCQAGSWQRRIYCTHCQTMTDAVTTSIVPCAGCGAHLFVRDHFSRRLRAFMGVRIDSEVHGDVPPAETFYP